MKTPPVVSASSYAASKAQSFRDDDYDDVYDNVAQVSRQICFDYIYTNQNEIQIDRRRLSKAASDFDTNSLSSNKAHNCDTNTLNSVTSNKSYASAKLGQLLRKIGAAGGSRNTSVASSSSSYGRHPAAASSLLSLNRVIGADDSHKQQHHHIGLMKSNSLSMEPWKRQIINGSIGGPTRMLFASLFIDRRIFYFQLHPTANDHRAVVSAVESNPYSAVRRNSMFRRNIYVV